MNTNWYFRIDQPIETSRVGSLLSMWNLVLCWYSKIARPRFESTCFSHKKKVLKKYFVFYYVADYVQNMQTIFELRFWAGEVHFWKGHWMCYFESLSLSFRKENNCEFFVFYKWQDYGNWTSCHLLIKTCSCVSVWRVCHLATNRSTVQSLCKTHHAGQGSGTLFIQRTTVFDAQYQETDISEENTFSFSVNTV